MQRLSETLRLTGAAARAAIVMTAVATIALVLYLIPRQSTYGKLLRKNGPSITGRLIVTFETYRLAAAASRLNSFPSTASKSSIFVRAGR